MVGEKRLPQAAVSDALPFTDTRSFPKRREGSTSHKSLVRINTSVRAMAFVRRTTSSVSDAAGPF